jgi:hypothetical protein
LGAQALAIRAAGTVGDRHRPPIPRRGSPDEKAVIEAAAKEQHCLGANALSHGPNGGVAYSLDEAKAAVRRPLALVRRPAPGQACPWRSSRPRPLYKRSHVALKTVPPDLRAVPAVWARLAARD